MIKVINGNSIEELKKFPDNYFGSVVTDPPYGLSFMGKKWDYDVPNVELWKEVFRVLKEGGHLLAFAGTRTQHRMAVNIEDAGFEIRDMIAWVYGSGFPKSHNIGKKIKKWKGWGTALKPALEPITMARKPFKTSVAENVLKNGVGGINIDGCRVKGKPRTTHIDRNYDTATNKIYGKRAGGKLDVPQGRFPANFIHDGSDEVLSSFPTTTSGYIANHHKFGNDRQSMFGNNKYQKSSQKQSLDKGSAARFFYCAKASKQDRNEGLEDFEDKLSSASEFRPINLEKTNKGENGNPYGRWKPLKNNHPTVKPTDLMRYLVRLVTPKNEIVLDCFMGSGSTGKACALEGLSFVGIDLDKDYCKIAKARIDKALEDKRIMDSQLKMF